MNTWIIITEEDVLKQLEPGQAECVRAADDFAVDVLRQVCSRVCSQLGLDAEDRHPCAVPAELSGVVLPLVVEALQARMPGLRLTEEQLRLASWARGYLRRVARGEVELRCQEEKAEPEAVKKRGKRVVVVQRRRGTNR